jgi:hypothetical protein
VGGWVAQACCYEAQELPAWQAPAGASCQCHLSPQCCLLRSAANAQ